jgi:hypothetical protein
MYNGLHISSQDVLALPDYEQRPYLVSKEWVEEKKREWGEDSALYQVRVMGDFPTSEADALIPLNALLEATERDAFADGVAEIGCDIARYGEAESVVCTRRGDAVVSFLITRNRDLMDLSNWIATEISQNTIVMDDGTKILPRVRVDEVGIGAGVLDRLRQMGYRVTGVNGGAKAYDYEKFADVRTEMYWRLREKFLERRIGIPNDEILVTQLAAIKHMYKSNGSRETIKIESKDAMHQRGLKSPDRADALALAFMGSVSAGGQTIMTSTGPTRRDISVGPLSISSSEGAETEEGAPERVRIASFGRRNFGRRSF